MKNNWINKETHICETCMYYIDAGNGLGRCRFNPPVVVSGFPVVYPTDKCGQHKLNSDYFAPKK